MEKIRKQTSSQLDRAGAGNLTGLTTREIQDICECLRSAGCFGVQEFEWRECGETGGSSVGSMKLQSRQFTKMNDAGAKFFNSIEAGRK